MAVHLIFLASQLETKHGQIRHCTATDIRPQRDLNPVLLHSWYSNTLFTVSFAAVANHYNAAFSFHQVAITAGWTEAVWNEKFGWHCYTWRAMWIEFQTFWSQVQCPIHFATCIQCHMHSFSGFYKIFQPDWNIASPLVLGKPFCCQTSKTSLMLVCLAGFSSATWFCLPYLWPLNFL